MKIDILALDLIVLAAVIVPYFIIVILGKKDLQQLKMIFQKAVDHNKLKLAEVDSWNNTLAGLDLENKKVLFVRKRKDSVLTDLLDLTTIKQCEVISQYRMTKREGKAEDLLQQVDLEITRNTGEKILLNLFDINIHFYQDYEIKHAEKWKQLINKNLQPNPVETVMRYAM